jgi:hypothetical protein
LVFPISSGFRITKDIRYSSVLLPEIVNPSAPPPLAVSPEAAPVIVLPITIIACLVFKKMISLDNKDVDHS